VYETKNGLYFVSLFMFFSLFVVKVNIELAVNVMGLDVYAQYAHVLWARMSIVRKNTNYFLYHTQ